MAVYKDIHLDPMWDCGPYEVTPEEDATWWIHCDHCYEIAWFRSSNCDPRDRNWCLEHAPFGGLYECCEPVEIPAQRWQSAREKRRFCQTLTPAPKPRGRRRWNLP